MPAAMTWNVRYFSQPAHGLRGTEEGIAAVAAAIREIGPEVALLQEVERGSLRAGRGEQAARLLARLPGYRLRYWAAHRYGPEAAPIYTTGLATLVREDVEILADNADAPVDITCRRIPLLAAWKQTRVAGWIRLRIGGRAVLAVNTHLSLPAFLTPHLFHLHDRMGHEDNQLREAEALIAAIRAAALPGEPILLGGDLNSAPGSPVLAALAAAGLRDAFAEAHAAASASPHPPAPLDAWTTQRLGARALHLDHLLSDGAGSVGGLRPTGIGPSHPAGPGRFDGLSDHWPKIIEFSLA